MQTPRLRHAIIVTLFLLAPVSVLAQGPGQHMGMSGGMGAGSATMKQMQGMIQQMGGMMEHMVDRIESGPMTPEHTTQMGEMMGHMADMMQKLGGMMGRGTTDAGKPGSGMMSPEMPQQMTTMMERMTDMHKRMMGMMAAPTPPPAAPQPDKK